MSVTRREFLLGSSVAPLLAGMGMPLLAAEPAKPTFPGMIVRSREPQNLEYPFSALDGAITPNEHFYVRNHFPAPAIDVNAWKLTIEGAVKHPLSLTYEDVLKLPSRTLTVTLECAGNGRVFLVPTANGTQWGLGAVGNAEWGGVPLSAILEKAGVKDGAVEVILEGADKGQVNSDPKSPGPIAFARSLPLDKARSNSVLLAYKMNGADLPAAHGTPLRAIVGGWYGMASVKWLTRIVVADKPYRGFWQTLDYSYWQRKDGLPTLLPLSRIEVKSSIARPAAGEIIAAGRPYRVFGAAWAGESAVAKVEISSDGGKSWNDTKLADKPVPMTWCLWEYIWKAPERAGAARLMCRAADSDGKSQPMSRDTDRRNYMITHVVPVEVTIR